MSILTGQAANGCDSIVDVTLTIIDASFFDLDDTLCPGETITVGGDTYDESNLNGTTILTGQAISGCDSIVNVNIEYEIPMADISASMICPDATTGLATISNITALSFPVTLTINNSSTEIINSLPFTFDLPIGVNTVSLLDINNCMFEEMVDITAIPSGNLIIDSTPLGINNYQLGLNSGLSYVRH